MNEAGMSRKHSRACRACQTRTRVDAGEVLRTVNS